MKFEKIVKEELNPLAASQPTTATPTSPIDTVKLAKDLTIIDTKIDQVKKAQQLNLDKLLEPLLKMKADISAKLQAVKPAAVVQPTAVQQKPTVGVTQ